MHSVNSLSMRASLVITQQLMKVLCEYLAIASLSFVAATSLKVKLVIVEE